MSATRRDFMTLTAAGLVAGSLEVSSARAEVGLPDGSTIELVRHADKKDQVTLHSRPMENYGQGPCVKRSRTRASRLT